MVGLPPRGATCPGGKINWDTGFKLTEVYFFKQTVEMQIKPFYSQQEYITGQQLSCERQSTIHCLSMEHFTE